MPEYNNNPDLIEQFMELTRRVDVLEKSNPLKNASIDGGTITVNSGTITVNGGSIVSKNGNIQVNDANGNPIIILGIDGSGYPRIGVYTAGGVEEFYASAIRVAAPGFSSQPNGNSTVGNVGTTTQIDGADVEVGYWPDTTAVNINSAGNITLSATGGAINVLPGSTTASAANAVINATTGSLQRSTSSLRYKCDVEDLEIDPEVVLQMRARTFRAKADVEENPDTTQRYVGYIAEEVDAIGLGMFVDYDEEGRPDAIQYDRLSTALLTVLKSQNERISALEAKLNQA